MNFLRKKRLSRRTVLKGAGISLSLPWLDIMMPEAMASTESPVRFVMMYYPNGFYMKDFAIEASQSMALTQQMVNSRASLKSLAPFYKKLIYMDQLENAPAYVWEDNLWHGAHARGSGTLLTQVPLSKKSLIAAQSLDQIFGKHFKTKGVTPLNSLVLGWTQKGGNGDEDGYANGFKQNISWVDERTPAEKMVNPLKVYDELVGKLGGQNAMNLIGTAQTPVKYRQSSLDIIKDQINALKKQLGQGDHYRLDQYLTSLREIEQDLNIGVAVQKDPQILAHCPNGQALTRFKVSLGTDNSFEHHARKMADLIALGFQCDLTRVATYMGQASFDDPGFSEFMQGVSEQHHTLSHKEGSKWQDQLSRISTWEVDQFAYLVAKLDSFTEANGRTILDNSLCCFTSEFGDGDGHEHKDFPMLIAGSGGGGLTPGHYVRASSSEGGRFDGGYAPLSALYLTFAKAMGVPLASGFGKVPRGMEASEDGYKGQWDRNNLETYATVALDQPGLTTKIS